MHHDPSPHARPLPGLVLALALGSALMSALLGGCAEMHRGAEAVGHIGGAPAAPAADVADDDAPSRPNARPNARPDIKTVRPRGARRAPAVDAGEQAAAEPAAAPAVVASAVPSPRQIFDFHPAGSSPDHWRQPFLIDTNDGPLAADVRRSSAELKSFLADQKAGRGRGGATETATAGTARTAGVDGVRTGTARRRCGEMDVAAGKPGCAVPRPGTAAAAAPQ